MWKFQDLPYKRPDMDQVKAEYLDAIRRFKAAATYEEAREAYLAQDRILRTLHTAEVIASIRNSTLSSMPDCCIAALAFFMPGSMPASAPSPPIECPSRIT